DLKDATTLSPDLLQSCKVICDHADCTPDICWQLVLISLKWMSHLDSSFDKALWSIHFLWNQRRKRLE
ncbi:MAG: hypothetical protein SGPRY_008708, partial [Prymnesium sp.]